ncbi:MAG TPA: bifunctional acetate--CoA ligase family protein/GNAT family N-acetyltransferase [Anaerolineae bacterium]|nr:bifunctional acetate--CoA ligase family protein/GNAT family N-acetyltransferase [Anaerolineae bacterium]
MNPPTTPTAAPFDRAADVLHFEPNPLDSIFAPKNVAVIGASETQGSVGRTIVWNLISSPFGGTVFPVNPKHPSILGIKTYPNIVSVPAKVDLAVIVTPAPTVPDIIKECVGAGVKGAIIISAGFKEVGPEGAELERRVLENARQGRMRIIGPNCLGVMNPLTGLNATFAATMARPGKVAFLSQSGALLTGVLDWSLRENVGFSAFVSVGSMLDVGWGDLIYYFGDDPRTEAIVMYMETIGDARAFLSAAREIAYTKPIIVIKPGRTAAAAHAAASHTGSLTGSDDVLDVAFKRVGVLRVNSISDLFYSAELLGKQPRPKGRNLTILTNAGGPGVLATDALVSGGGKLTPLSPATMDALNQLLPAAWSHNNPVDILGDASPERYAKVLELTAKDPNADGLLVILTPQAMTDPTLTADQLKPYAKIPNKPILASWMGGTQVEAGDNILSQAGIPTFSYPDTAARMFNYMWQYAENLRLVYETPALANANDPDRAHASEIIESARRAGRILLNEYESKQLLAAYDIPIVETRVATTADDAVRGADEIGYPVVLKLYSNTITHKTDVGGVKLNLRDANAVRVAFNAIQQSVTEKASAADFQGVTVQPMIKWEGYELIFGSSPDPQFGPVILFGMGGQLVEVFQDRALGLPPLNTTLARRMMERTKIYTALQGVRGRAPVDVDALAQLLVRFSELVVEQRFIKEIDINPLLASPEKLLALDARVILYDQSTTAEQLPRLAIRPYPLKYVEQWTTKDGIPLTIRPIRPEDEPLMVEYHKNISERSVYLRYLHPMALDARISHDRLSRIVFIDYDREMALVAEATDPHTHQRQIVGVGRLSKLYGTQDAEFSLLLIDSFQGKGLGTELLKKLIQIGRDEKLRRIIAYISSENYAMQTVSKNLGFILHRNMDDPTIVEAELVL